MTLTVSVTVAMMLTLHDVKMTIHDMIWNYMILVFVYKVEHGYSGE